MLPICMLVIHRKSNILLVSETHNQHAYSLILYVLIEFQGIIALVLSNDTYCACTTTHQYKLDTHEQIQEFVRGGPNSITFFFFFFLILVDEG